MESKELGRKQMMSKRKAGLIRLPSGTLPFSCVWACLPGSLRCSGLRAHSKARVNIGRVGWAAVFVGGLYSFGF